MIFRNPLRLKIYLYPERIDMRKSWSGLLSLVQEGMSLNAYEESLFVFCGRSGRLVKLMFPPFAPRAQTLQTCTFFRRRLRRFVGRERILHLDEEA